MVNDSFSVTGKVALVTGASSGLGERFARVLAERGAKVVCVARHIDNLEKVAGDISNAGGTALDVVGDVSDCSSMEAAFDTAEKAFGVVDILVNCAGIQAMADMLEVEDDQWTSTIDINVSGLWRTTQIFSQRLLKADKSGSIINIAAILRLAARAGTDQAIESSLEVFNTLFDGTNKGQLLVQIGNLDS